MAVPNTFGTATSAIPLSQLDANFNTPITLGNTAIQLGDTVTTLNNMTLANVTISSGNVTITNVAITTANVSGTANISTLVVTANASVAGNVSVTGNTTVAGSVVLSGGTANGVAYLNTSKQLTTGSALTFDGTNLGVGTASVSNPNGFSKASNFIGGASGTGGYGIYLGNTLNLGIIGYFNSDMSVTNNAAGNITFNINSSEIMRLTSTSLYTASTINVGIGLSNPTAKLDVDKSANDTITRANAAGAFGDLFTLGAGLLMQQTLSSPYGFALQAANAANTFQFPLLLNPSGGNVGIGTVSPAYKLDVAGTAASQLRLQNSDATSYASMLFTGTGRSFSMGVGNASETGIGVANQFYIYDITAAQTRLRLDSNGGLQVSNTIGVGNTAPSTSGAGITFPATQSASSDANTLDDYEEGTFTPTIVGSTTAGTGTYSEQRGKYTKIGNVVNFKLFVLWSAHTGAGNMLIAGLPFTSPSDAHDSSVSVGYLSTLALSALNVITALVGVNANQITLLQYPTGGGTSATVPIDADAGIEVAGMYFV